MITNEVSLCIRDSHFLIVGKTAEQIFRAIEFSLSYNFLFTEISIRWTISDLLSIQIQFQISPTEVVFVCGGAVLRCVVVWRGLRVSAIVSTATTSSSPHPPRPLFSYVTLLPHLPLPSSVTAW